MSLGDPGGCAGQALEAAGLQCGVSRQDSGKNELELTQGLCHEFLRGMPRSQRRFAMNC